MPKPTPNIKGSALAGQLSGTSSSAGQILCGNWPEKLNARVPTEAYTVNGQYSATPKMPCFGISSRVKVVVLQYDRSETLKQSRRL
jgi:hypothetical protein